MSDLETRKRMLVAESEVYRELLKLQIHNLRIDGIRARKRFKIFRIFSPLLMMSLPMAGSLFKAKRRRFTWKRIGALAFVAWRFYQKVGAVLGGFAARSRHQATAAEEYLEKRI
jgi:hypothetical protein